MTDEFDSPIAKAVNHIGKYFSLIELSFEIKELTGRFPSDYELKNWLKRNGYKWDGKTWSKGVDLNGRL